MKKYSKSHHSSLHELNITPLLDLAFVLLVIFIITTAPTVTDIDVSLPSASTQPKDAAKPKVNNVALTKDGKVYFNAQPVTLDELKEKLIDYIKNDPEINVVVRGDKGANYQELMKVLDTLAAANVTKIGLATDISTN